MVEFNEQLQKKIKNAPVDAGCYQFKNRSGKIIYIGKAKNLRNRIRNYFFNQKSLDIKTGSLVKKIQDVEFIVTHSEVEALILENSLIKKNRPKYNVLLRDDKTFPYVRITNEDFPKFFTTRKVIKDGSKYFGPYTDAGALKKTLKILRTLFPVRNCNLKLNEADIAAGKFKVCLNYHIHKCEGPCEAHISKSDYAKMIDKVLAFLNGKSDEVLDFFQENMTTASASLNFEDAARYRDNISILKTYSSRQSVEKVDFKDRDLLHITIEAENGCAVMFRIRNGKLIGRETYFLENTDQVEKAEIMHRFIQQYYTNADYIPSEVLVSDYPGEADVLETWLTEKRGRKVTIFSPDRDDKLRLMRMAERNGRLKLDEYIAKKIERADYTPKTLLQLQENLQLDSLPRWIEAFDISNTSGQFAVGSLVCFVNAKPKKSEYRKFRIKTVKDINDFAMMEEVIRRRYTRQKEEKNPLPDLILVDGGKGQLSSAKSILDDLDLSHIPIVGLAKRLEEIFTPESSEPILLPKDSPALILLQKLRDESHRFAITYHRKLRSEDKKQSILDDIPGLGKEKQKALYKHFKTVSKMSAAGLEDLCLVPGIGPKLARTIWTFLHEKK